MGKHSVNVNFRVKKSRKNKDGMSPIECNICVNGEIKFQNLLAF